MSASKPKKNEKLKTVSGKSVDVGTVADHAVVEALAPVNLLEETEWFEIKGIRVKAVKVAPSVYQAAQSHLRALMRGNAPKPPMQKGPDGKLKPNTFHPDFKKEQMEWEQLYTDIDEDLYFSIAILAGLHIHSEDGSKIPPREMWLPTIEAQLKMIGIDLNMSAEYLMYSGDPEVLDMLLFKKYILLDDAKLFKSFMKFQQKESPNSNIPLELMSRYSADMFSGSPE